MHNFVVSQNNTISIHKIMLRGLVPIFYIYFDHTNFFIFINSYYLNLHLYFGNIFSKYFGSPSAVLTAYGASSLWGNHAGRCAEMGIPAQRNNRKIKLLSGERKLPVKPGRKCRLVGTEPMIGAETENENKTFGPSGLVRNRP